MQDAPNFNPDQMIPHQSPAPVMINPVLVCNPHGMMPPQPIQGTFQNQPVILNVKNIPPWLQKHNIVYYQPNQYHPYINANTIQNIQPYYLQSQEMIRNTQMPVLTQILNQNPLNYEKTVKNQQIQTNFKARPQMINPVQKDQKAEVPVNLKDRIPNSISVRAIYNPVLPRSRPNLRPNVYVNPFINTNQNIAQFETSKAAENMKTALNDHLSRNQNMFSQTHLVKLPERVDNIKNDLAIKDRIKEEDMKNVSLQDNVNNEGHKISATANHNLIGHQNINKIETVNSEKATNTLSNDKTEILNEEKMRNTVFVQARGRFINENTAKHIKMDTNDMKTSKNDDKQTEKQTNESKNQTNCDKSKEFDKDHVERDINVTKVGTKIDNISKSPDEIANNSTIGSRSNKISLLQRNTDEICKIDLRASGVIVKVDESYSKSIEDKTRINKKMDLLNKTNIKIDKMEVNPIKNTENVEKSNKNDLKIENNTKNMKNNSIVLTHVLNGHIIQESNTAFPILKKDSTKKAVSKSMKHINDVSYIDTLPILPVRYVQDTGTNLDLKTNLDLGNPFKDVNKSTLSKWTANQLFHHLSNFGWRDTARLLHEQELDGEALLLANKQQLINIGIEQTYAHAIQVFLSI